VLHHHATISPVDSAHELVAASVGPSGELVALWSAADLAPRHTSPGGAGSAGTRTAGVEAWVTTQAPDRTTAVRIPRLELAFPLIQPLPDGRFLIAGARCRQRLDR
jgi:hypothetical protein